MKRATGKQAGRRRTWYFLAAGLLAMLAMTAAWRWTPLHEYADPAMVAKWLHAMARSPWMPLVIAAVYVGSNAVMFPNTVLCFATILALGTTPGFAYAMGGSVLAAVAAYLVGRRYGVSRKRRLDNATLERMRRALAHGGVTQVLLLRLLPLAPFTVVNVMAGAARVGFAPYFIGTTLGLLPGNLLFALFGGQLRRTLAHPSPGEVATMAVVVVVASVALWQLQRLAANAR